MSAKGKEKTYKRGVALGNFKLDEYIEETNGIEC